MKRIPILILFLAAATPAEAGPWSPPAGGGYFKLGSRLLAAARYTNGDGETQPIDGYQELTLQTYGELGLGKKLTAVFQADLLRFARVEHPENDPLSTLRAGDPELGLRWQFFGSKHWAAAVEESLKIPINSSDPWAEVTTPEGAPLGRVVFGTGTFDARTTLSLGFAEGPLDAAVSLGWIARTGGYDHQLCWSAEFGGTWDPFFGRLRIGGRHSFDVGDVAPQENISGQGNGTSHSSMIFELGANLGGGFSIGATPELTLFGLGIRRQARGPGFSVFGAWRW